MVAEGREGEVTHQAQRKNLTDRKGETKRMGQEETWKSVLRDVGGPWSERERMLVLDKDEKYRVRGGQLVMEVVSSRLANQDPP